MLGVSAGIGILVGTKKKKKKKKKKRLEDCKKLGKKNVQADILGLCT